MRRFSLALLFLIAANPAETVDKDTHLGAPLTFKNLTLLPLIADKVDNADYLVLDEGMEKGVVKVTEIGTGQVNSVTLENKGDKALFVMAGEVILGGNQDRVIGQDTVIAPKQKVDLPVFCVEHGRWSGDDKAAFQAGKALAHDDLRKKAKYESQGAVWDEVSKKNTARQTENSTDTYRQVATGKDVEKAIAPYAKYFEDAIAKSPDAARTVGYVLVLNGKIVGLERFRSPKLLAKFQPKLLRSYYVQAVDLPVEAKVKLPDAKAVQTFADKAQKAKKKTIAERKAAKTYQFDMDGVEGTSVIEAADPYAPAASPPAEVYHSYSAH